VAFSNCAEPVRHAVRIQTVHNGQSQICVTHHLLLHISGLSEPGQGMRISLVVGFFSSALAHTRLECPPPRSGRTGNKIGPCDAPDNTDVPPFALQPNALNTITWLESISHPGAPARFALSLDNEDEGFESCLLLDHVPHDERSQPVANAPTTWHRSSITLWIPDVYCERCHLQLLTVMSDEFHGVPVNTSCIYAGAWNAGTVTSTFPDCPDVYHSCAPVSINGTIPRDEYTCNTTEFEEHLDWPLLPSRNPDLYSHSTYYFKGDPGMYEQTQLAAIGAPLVDCNDGSFCDPDSFFRQVLSVPLNAKYATLEGSCAAIKDTQVAEFAPGVLPSIPKPDLCEMCNRRCYFDACDMRNTTTGLWKDSAERCNLEESACEDCFPESPCRSSTEEPEESTKPTMNSTDTVDETEDPQEENEGNDEKSESSFAPTIWTSYSVWALPGAL